MILTGDDPGQLLSFAGLERETMTDSGLAFVRRETPAGFVYFIKNKAEKTFEGWLPISTVTASAGIYNPMDGRSGTAIIRPGKDEGPEIYIKIDSEESLIIETYNNKIEGNSYQFYSPAASPMVITGTWRVDFIEGGPSLPQGKETDQLVSWTDMDSEDLKNFSGTARYTISFKKPSGKADGWELNLGKVFESATVILNGEELGSLIGPHFNLILNTKQLKKNNLLEIRVSNLMANRIAYMDRNNITWKKFYNINMAARMKQNSKNGLFDASGWDPVESGLIGPVTITPLSRIK